MTNQTGFLKRINKIPAILQDKKIDFLLINDSIAIFYLTGLKLSKGQILVGSKGATLFVDGRYIAYAQEKAPIPVLPLHKESYLAYFAENRDSSSPSLGFDATSVTFAEFQEFSSLCQQTSLQGKITLIPLTNPLKELRAIKESEEITAMKKSSALNWRGFEYVCSLLREGVTEREMSREFEVFCLKEGAEKMAFPPHVAFGKNSAYPHYTPGNTALAKDDLVLIDVGVVVDGYCSDMTRTLFFGQLDPKWEELYSYVRMAHAKALSLLTPGRRLSEIDRAVRSFFEEKGVLQEFVHALGHGVGLQIHEFPSFKENAEERELAIKPGMVFTIEPGLYRVGVGGVRYEDTVLITSSGYENFYES